MKLAILADAAKYDVSCASSGSRRSTPRGGVGRCTALGVCHSFTPDGRCIALLKILLTNYCISDCKYCANRRSADVRRARFTPAEVVYLTMEFYRRNYIEGLFLSSGVIRSPDETMVELAEVAGTLRQRERFGGYIHLKAVPGASAELLALAGRFADRLSANIELPTQHELEQLAPDKRVGVIERAMDEIDQRTRAAREERRKDRRAAAFAPGGQSTQMIVGATLASDASILSTASRLYGRYRLRRVYYSAYAPPPRPDPLLPAAAPPLLREHRLYQADWLLRFYGFDVGEILDPAAPNLDLRIDPKLAWALRHRGFFPVDLNRAERERLLRVPGLGVRTVERILRMRGVYSLRLEDLRRLRVSLEKVGPWVTATNHNPHVLRLNPLESSRRTEYRQLELFESLQAARGGEL